MINILKMLNFNESFEIDGELHDAVELMLEYKLVIKAVEKQVDEELKDYPMRGMMGFCHAYWHRVTEILKEEHRIIWRSPAKNEPLELL